MACYANLLIGNFICPIIVARQVVQSGFTRAFSQKIAAAGNNGNVRLESEFNW